LTTLAPASRNGATLRVQNPLAGVQNPAPARLNLASISPQLISLAGLPHSWILQISPELPRTVPSLTLPAAAPARWEPSRLQHDSRWWPPCCSISVVGGGLAAPVPVLISLVAMRKNLAPGIEVPHDRYIHLDLDIPYLYV